MIKYPLFFEVKALSTKGVATPMEATAENFPPIACSIPKEFMGPGSGYSPEDLFSLSLLTCLIATFKVFAEKSKFEFEKVHAEAKLTIDRNAQGIPELKKIDVTFSLSGVQDQDKAKMLLGEAQKYCLVSNALKTEKAFHYNFE